MLVVLVLYVRVVLYIALYIALAFVGALLAVRVSHNLWIACAKPKPKPKSKVMDRSRVSL